MGCLIVFKMIKRVEDGEISSSALCLMHFGPYFFNWRLDGLKCDGPLYFTRKAG